MAVSDGKKGAVSGVLVPTPSKPVTTECWSCGAMRAAHYCQECGKVQPPAPVDYFTFFGLPWKLNLDTAQLERDFYALSRKIHPDINARLSGPEQEWSLEKTSQLNDAYRTLKDPISRTVYLLRLQGVQLEEQSKTATEEARKTGAAKKQVVPPDLLEEVFELNMQLEELRMNKKMDEDDPALTRDIRSAKDHLVAKHHEMLSELQAAWTSWDALVDRAAAGETVAEPERAAARDMMLAVLNRRSYLRNLLREIDEVLES
ncbi:MAG TPA: Fe-S protein assembly co-chaperone HscB [Candidatus Eisenbacteria bacterium]|nr:Fe-S protein assembly co-chaperone HscB [Candidatus Eisenbacteria bacterium]